MDHMTKTSKIGTWGAAELLKMVRERQKLVKVCKMVGTKGCWNMVVERKGGGKLLNRAESNSNVQGPPNPFLSFFFFLVSLVEHLFKKKNSLHIIFALFCRH